MTINQVVIAGRLTKDPETRYTTNNNAVCSFTVALDRYMGKAKEKETDYISVVAWSETAEFVSKYFSKGRKIIVAGNLRQRSWKDDKEQMRYTTEVWAEKVDFADSKKEDGAAPADRPAARSNPQNGAEPPWAQGAGQAAAPANPPPQAEAQTAFPWVKGGA
jgi:single-strand DNA-binding protein